MAVRQARIILPPRPAVKRKSPQLPHFGGGRLGREGDAGGGCRLLAAEAGGGGLMVTRNLGKERKDGGMPDLVQTACLRGGRCAGLFRKIMRPTYNEFGLNSSPCSACQGVSDPSENSVSPKLPPHHHSPPPHSVTIPCINPISIQFPPSYQRRPRHVSSP